jgi:hypothetical protein
MIICVYAVHLRGRERERKRRVITNVLYKVRIL